MNIFESWHPAQSRTTPPLPPSLPPCPQPPCAAALQTVIINGTHLLFVETWAHIISWRTWRVSLFIMLSRGAYGLLSEDCRWFLFPGWQDLRPTVKEWNKGPCCHIGTSTVQCGQSFYSAFLSVLCSLVYMYACHMASILITVLECLPH